MTLDEFSKATLQSLGGTHHVIYAHATDHEGKFTIYVFDDSIRAVGVRHNEQISSFVVSDTLRDYLITLQSLMGNPE